MYLFALRLALIAACLKLAWPGDLIAAESSRAVSGERHPISIIATDVYVSRTKVNMRLSMFAEDLYLFHNIEPNEFDRLQPDDLRWALEEHKDFLLDRVLVMDKDGNRITGRVVNMEPFDIPAEGIEVGRLMEYPMIYQLAFNYDEPPEFLTFQQEIVDDNFVFPSEMQLSLKQSGIEETTTKVLRPSEPFTRRFDWSLESLDSEDDEQAWTDWYNRQREETLGITSYGSIYSFLYVNPREVRFEILIPLGTLSTLIDIERADRNYLEIEEQDRLRPEIESFLLEKNPVNIDGIRVLPVFARVDFYGLDLRDFAMQAERKQVSMASGRVGIIMEYPLKQSPSEVSLNWNLFGPNIVSVETVVFDNDETRRARFSRFKDELENTYVWRNDGANALPNLDEVGVDRPIHPKQKMPIVSLGLFAALLPLALVLVISRQKLGVWLIAVGLLVTSAGITWPLLRHTVDDPFWSPPHPTSEYRTSVFTRLHANTYRAFDYHSQSQVYDALANSVSGELLREIYLDVRAGMVIESEGGAVARIRSVEIDELKLPEDIAGETAWQSFRVDCQWRVNGTIEHWGHIHERENTYNGEFVVEVHDNSWRISEMLVKDVEIRNRRGLRRF